MVITPKPIKAVDQTIFVATAMGDLRVSILNGASMTAVTLKGALYFPDLVFTLVSLTRCDIAGYSTLLKDRRCTISDPHGLVLGHVPFTEGLYKHVYTPKTAETANLAQKVLSLDDLHRWMGHISPNAAKTLVKNGHVTGLTLDMSSEASFCEACAKAKPTRKTVPKERGGPHATNIGEKVHSDVWGPATPQSLDGKEYFVSFTDNYLRWSTVEAMS